MKKFDEFNRDQDDDFNILTYVSQNNLLRSAYKYVVEHNLSNDAPYHNLSHILTVTKQVYIISYWEQIKIICGRGRDSINVDNLMLAALFHDVNHSMGKEKDSVNVKNAIDAFITFSEINNLSEDIEKRVIELISITEFPYTIDSSKLDLEQQILRDADMLQRYEDNWYDMIIVGLAKEMNQTLEQRIAQEKTFSFNPSFNTDYAKRIKEKYEEILRDKIRKL